MSSRRDLIALILTITMVAQSSDTSYAAAPSKTTEGAKVAKSSNRKSRLPPSASRRQSDALLQSAKPQTETMRFLDAPNGGAGGM